MLTKAGLPTIVMGGHAVRYYGVTRNTADFDLVIAILNESQIYAVLQSIDELKDAKPIPVWRTGDFARFEIGTLPDGRQELLEFWMHNHLLDPFGQLLARAETGLYGGTPVNFLSIDDLIRSKETERESDWQDIALLEEIRDARLFKNALMTNVPSSALSQLRSRRGIESIVSTGWFNNTAHVRESIAICNHPVTFAILYPAVSDRPHKMMKLIDPNVLKKLASCSIHSAQHIALIEIVRRSYKRAAMEKDRNEKLNQVALRRDSQQAT
jgi:hypothetical protein